MARYLLTARKIDSESTPGVLKDGDGLRLIVTARGTKRWELWISINGKPRQLGFGAYPDVSLRDARDEADKIRSAAHRGIDPKRHRLQEQDALGIGGRNHVALAGMPGSGPRVGGDLIVIKRERCVMCHSR